MSASRLTDPRTLRLVAAVTAIWSHTETHTTFVEGVGYTSRSDQQTCGDPAHHAKLALEEGAAWREARLLLMWPDGCPSCWMNPTDHDYPEGCPENAPDRTSAQVKETERMSEARVARDTRPRWMRGDWPHRIMRLAGSESGGNACPPGDWMAFKYGYENAEAGKGCASSAAVPMSLHYSCASITDDGFTVMFGYCHEWKWSMSFKDALRFALWMVFRVWVVEQWFGLRRWIYYRALHEAVRPYTQFAQAAGLPKE